MVISAGTRNHFALDLGLDRDVPSACLDALTDGVELRIDPGLIGDRTFVNNACAARRSPSRAPRAAPPAHERRHHDRGNFHGAVAPQLPRAASRTDRR
jgi:hypothetical protein